MFTGIIQNKGIITEKKEQGNQVHFVLKWKHPEKNIQMGESIATNGVCLTVAAFTRTAFEVDLIRQTLEATNLGELEIGDEVNLERSLRWGDPMGGHFVSGHVDDCGVLKKMIRQGKNWTFVVSFPSYLSPFIIRKGSVAIDGVSLTIQSVKKNTFTVGLVPHTLKETNLGSKKQGDRLNLEVDLLCRYLAHLKKHKKVVSLGKWLGLQVPSQSRLSVSALKKMGF